jgi:hypothetical protein
MRKIILHVGADKCGSSSIQGYLTKNPTPESLGNPDLQYTCLLNNGIIGPEGILEQVRTSPVGYISSADIAGIQLLNKEAQNTVRTFFKQSEIGHVLSCEGWLRSLSYPGNIEFLLSLLNSSDNNTAIEIHAFVRPPVQWINSAWWQWGAWSGEDFDSWLDKSILGSFWYNFLSGYFANKSINRVCVMPMTGDVVQQFCESASITYDKTRGSRSNISMPREAILLMLKHRQHRPSSHSPISEFLLARALTPNRSLYHSTPWALNPTHVEKIISSTKKCNLRLLELMAEPDRSKVLSDPSWWDPDFYKNRESVDPSDPGPISTDQALQMASDLLLFTAEAAKVLVANKLIDQVLRIDS